MASGSSTANLPPPISAERTGNASGRPARSTTPDCRISLPSRGSGQAGPLEEFGNSREGFVALFEHSGKEIETVWHPLADKMLDLRHAGRTQLLRKAVVVVDERISRAGGNERGGISAQILPGPGWRADVPGSCHGPDRRRE